LDVLDGFVVYGVELVVVLDIVGVVFGEVGGPGGDVGGGGSEGELLDAQSGLADGE